MGEQLRKVTLDFEKRRLQFESTSAHILRLSLGETGINWEFLSPPAGAEPVKIKIEEKRAELQQQEQNVAQKEDSATTEAKKTQVLSGVVKGPVRPGRPDNNGKPTFYHLGAMHIDGEEEAVMFLVSHYRHAATIAGQYLKPEASFTAEGYPQPSVQEGRNPRFNVFHLIDYPGKPPK